mgnify:CR=1 FL=1
MKKLNVFNTVLLVLGLSALLFAINAYRKTLLLFNPQAVIAAYFTFGLFIGLAFHRKDIQKISKASIISAFCIGLLYLFLLSLTAPQFNAFRLISDTSMLLLGLGLIEILFCGK